MSARKKSRLTPRTVRTNKELCALPRDNVDFKRFWALVGETTITITEQTAGESATASITIPKRIFDKIVDFYNGEVPHVQ